MDLTPIMTIWWKTGLDRILIAQMGNSKCVSNLYLHLELGGVILKWNTWLFEQKIPVLDILLTLFILKGQTELRMITSCTDSLHQSLDLVQDYFHKRTWSQSPSSNMFFLGRFSTPFLKCAFFLFAVCCLYPLFWLAKLRT